MLATPAPGFALLDGPAPAVPRFSAKKLLAYLDVSTPGRSKRKASNVAKTSMRLVSRLSCPALSPACRWCLHTVLPEPGNGLRRTMPIRAIQEGDRRALAVF